jgi:hypothetical protein
LRKSLSILIAGLSAFAMALGLGLGLGLETAAAGTIKDCEKITAADAYNQCLASFGPAAREHELKPVPANIGSGQLYGHHRHYAHYRHGPGKQQMEISVAPGSEQD